jgi:hypothetical protein
MDPRVKLEDEEKKLFSVPLLISVKAGIYV